MSDRRKAEAAAERVRHFLVARSRQRGNDPDVVYSVSSGDDVQVELRVSDLIALVQAQLGSDAEVVDTAEVERNKRSARRSAELIDEHLRGKRLPDAP